MNSLNRPPKWAYLIAGILIVMSLLLGGTIMLVLLYMLQGIDIQVPLQFIILPLIAFIVLIVPIFAFVLTRNKEQSQ